jgi:O-antigen/teichoic acid export membrane protein
MRALIASAYPFIVINLAALGAFQVDRFVAYHYLSSTETAKLDVTMRVLMAIYTLYSVLIAKLWRTIGEAWNNGEVAKSRVILVQGLWRAGLFWTAVAAVLVPTLDPIIKSFTRGTIRVEDHAFALAALSYVGARSIVDTVSVAIFATRRQHLTMKTVIAHGVLNIPCSILGCLAFGLPGIMLGQLLSLLLTSGWRFPIIFWRTTELRA